ncbi:uncharacterized protein BJ171DRAFT_146002 [Polychytrium aggregatum]|uniref:uncharacterized protein n=1 Tax=Polychytrium aggregatum TaxID=110093 RepID=UPI0022FEFA01|nr:uncharacterized protein BJ171DRAFT_146002 [Polychytrium aggregatum]KAI9203559.1 hypothetical protein BJ171DRAFT_146002 [Polychytrium aggregatum]
MNTLCLCPLPSFTLALSFLFACLSAFPSFCLFVSRAVLPCCLIASTRAVGVPFPLPCCWSWVTPTTPPRRRLTPWRRHAAATDAR